MAARPSPELTPNDFVSSIATAHLLTAALRMTLQEFPGAGLSPEARIAATAVALQAERLVMELADGFGRLRQLGFGRPAPAGEAP
ncbi:MAG: hypothetical protein K2X71_29100 [Methylobacterium sp.]|uniref:hypothetical protein n=1 Tax=Methylobacterium sp. TaxID=409 RepID=UPI002584812F|nr:hypothetical protein [Methylobacterium sp.]MBY0300049.1 hypothetical protein [Methylobacterium sp.]